MSNRTQLHQETPSFVLAFDIGGTKIAIATASANREILDRTEISTVDCGDGPSALGKAIRAGIELVRETKQKGGGELLGVGVASVGITFPDRVEMSPNIPGWENLRIESTLSEAFPSLPITIDNDVKAAALAEVKRGALKGKDHGLYVNFGTGISMAYTMEGRVIKGHNGASGEIAYFLRDKNERFGIRAGAAPFEEFVGGRAIGLRASDYFGAPMTTKLLFQRAETDQAARRFVEDILQEMAFQLTNVIIGWDPETVAFGGGLMTGSEVVLPFIEQRVKQFVPFPPELVVAHFDRDAGLYGAIELAL